jgi:alpha-tubulin suppressor-like RCC1 family protein
MTPPLPRRGPGLLSRASQVYHLPATLVLGALFLVACAILGPGEDTGDAVAISVGFAHTCTLTAGGDVWCWGRDVAGEIGLGDTVTPDRFGHRRIREPARVPVSGMRAVAAGWQSTCAIRERDARVFCWGDNYAGQFGLPDQTYVWTPTEVPLPGEIRQAAAAVGVLCALTETEAVECTGTDEQFAVTGSKLLAGDPYPGQYRSIALGRLSYCAISVTNDAFCWGSNSNGRLLPDSATEKISEPVLIERDVASIAIGESFGCAVFVDGTARCWGRDLFGNPIIPDTAGIGPIEMIAVGRLASWILSRSGEVWPLGPAHPITGAPATGPVNRHFRARSIAAGFDHACALSEDGSVWCWGSNSDGAVGIGAEAASSVPVRVFP